MPHRVRAGTQRAGLWGLALCWCLLTHELHAQNFTVMIDSLTSSEAGLAVSFHADSLLSSRLLYNIQRGVTSAASFRVQLWRKRWLFTSTLVAERQYEIKTAFDQWDKKFIIETATERRLTGSLEFVRTLWERHEGVLVADSSQLNAKHNYFASVEVLLQPVSRESLQEIRGWLAGEVKSFKSEDSTAQPAPAPSFFGDRMLGLVIDLTGFGEKLVAVKSRDFRVTAKGVKFRD